MTQQGKPLIAFRSWVPLDTELWDKPEVMEIHEMTGFPISQVVGLLSRAWSWMSSHGHFDEEEGSCFVDAPPRRLVTITRGESSMEFWEAVASVGWIELGERSISIPHGDRWLSTDARKRLLNAERMRAKRAEVKAEKESCDSVRSSCEVLRTDRAQACEVRAENVRTDQIRSEEKRRDLEEIHSEDPLEGKPRARAPEPPSLEVQTSDLRDPGRIVQMGLSLAGLPDTEHNRRQILAAAVHAKRVAKNPPAYFASVCRKKDFSGLTNQDDDDVEEILKGPKRWRPQLVDGLPAPGEAASVGAALGLGGVG